LYQKRTTDDGRRYVDLLLRLLQTEKTVSDRRFSRRTRLVVTHDEKEDIQTQARAFSRLEIDVIALSPRTPEASDTLLGFNEQVG
jgi:hypothetical protein